MLFSEIEGSQTSEVLASRRAYGLLTKETRFFLPKLRVLGEYFS